MSKYIIAVRKRLVICAYLHAYAICLHSHRHFTLSHKSPYKANIKRRGKTLGRYE